MAVGKNGETLICFRSGHYKKVRGRWKGDSIWIHFEKENGGEVHVNKEEVEYMETFENRKGGVAETPGSDEIMIYDPNCESCMRNAGVEAQKYKKEKK